MTVNKEIKQLIEDSTRMKIVQDYVRDATYLDKNEISIILGIQTGKEKEPGEAATSTDSNNK